MSTRKIIIAIATISILIALLFLTANAKLIPVTEWTPMWGSPVMARAVVPGTEPAATPTPTPDNATSLPFSTLLSASRSIFDGYSSPGLQLIMPEFGPSSTFQRLNGGQEKNFFYGILSGIRNLPATDLSDSQYTPTSTPTATSASNPTATPTAAPTLTQTPAFSDISSPIVQGDYPGPRYTQKQKDEALKIAATSPFCKEYNQYPDESWGCQWVDPYDGHTMLVSHNFGGFIKGFVVDLNTGTIVEQI